MEEIKGKCRYLDFFYNEIKTSCGHHSLSLHEIKQFAHSVSKKTLLCLMPENNHTALERLEGE